MLIVCLFAIALVATYFKGYNDGRIDTAEEFIEEIEESIQENEKGNDTKD